MKLPFTTLWNSGAVCVWSSQTLIHVWCGWSGKHLNMWCGVISYYFYGLINSVLMHVICRVSCMILYYIIILNCWWHVAVCTKIWKATPFVANDNSSCSNLVFSMSRRVMPREKGTHFSTDYYDLNRDMNFTQPNCLGINRGVDTIFWYVSK
jgi:hypothetical protein